MTDNKSSLSGFFRNISEKLRDPESKVRENIRHTAGTMKDGMSKAGEKISEGIEKTVEVANDIRESVAEQKKFDQEVQKLKDHENSLMKDKSREDRIDNIFGTPARPVDSDMITKEEERATIVFGKPGVGKTVPSAVPSGVSLSDLIGKSPEKEEDPAIEQLDDTYREALSQLAHTESDRQEIQNRIEESMKDSTANEVSLKNTMKKISEAITTTVEDVVEEVSEKAEEVVEEVEDAVEEKDAEEALNSLSVLTESSGVDNIITVGLTANEGKAFTAAELNTFAKDNNIKYVRLTVNATKDANGKTKTDLALDAIAKFEEKVLAAKSASAVQTVFLVNAKSSTAGLSKVVKAVQELSETAQGEIAGVIVLTGKNPVAASVKKIIRASI